ncbi:hypothetical protein DL765_011185 [Monosporascus sp. GIB2]|nr:hypothetical protein DL765_011185 [Monosporascus sp. GIB2]
MHGSNRDKEPSAMGWMSHLSGCMGRCQSSGVGYANGSWGYTVLRTAYSAEADAIWATALGKLRRWVTQYFIHQNRLIHNKPDSSVNEEVARRFILEVFEDPNSEKLKLPDIAKASQDDITPLTDVFEAWVHNAVGNVDFDPADNPRFCNFLVIDEGSLRSLVALPDETPSLELVSREERRARSKLWSHAYVWLVDSPAARRFQGVNGGDNYNGWMKLNPSDLPAAWFERVARFEDETWIFGRREIPEGSGDLWYHQR